MAHFKGESIITSFSANENESEASKSSNSSKVQNISLEISKSERRQEPELQPQLTLSLKQPVWHVLVLGGVTLTFYWVYWCYKNWRDLSRQLGSDGMSINKSAAAISNVSSVPNLNVSSVQNPHVLTVSNPNASNPGVPNRNPDKSWLVKILPDELASFHDSLPALRGLMMLVPYINNYLFFTLALGVARLQPNKKTIVGTHPLLCSIAVAISSFVLWNLWRLPVLFGLPAACYLLFLLASVPPAIVQFWLNRYWDSVERPGLLVRHGFSLKELVVIIAGGLLLGFIVTSFILGINK